MLRRAIRTITYLVLAVGLGLLCLYTYNVAYIESRDPLTSAPRTTHFADMAGERIAYSEVDNGSDTTVLFVGGLSAWSGTWQRVISVQNERTKRFNYVALDLPPFGYSSPDAKRNYFRDTQASRIAAFVEKKKFKKLILVGHSYGGGPMTEYAMHHPERVQKLILIDAVLNAGEKKAVPSYSVVQITPLRTGLIGVLLHSESIAESRLRSFVYITDHIDRALTGTYTQYFVTDGVTQRLSDWARDYTRDPLIYGSTDLAEYAKLPFPVRLIWGDKDTLTPIAGAEMLVPVIPDAQLITLKNVGHIPMIEDYTAFDAALAGALDK